MASKKDQISKCIPFQAFGFIDDEKGNTFSKDGKNHMEKDEETITWSVKWHSFFSSDWSVAGMKYILMTGAARIRRLTWLIFVLFGFGFMIFQFYDRISYFVSNPTSVNINVNYENELDFPTVTICNENQASLEKAQNIPGLPGLIRHLYPPYSVSPIEPNETYVLEAIQEINSLNKTWDSIWQEISPSYDSAGIVSCLFNGNPCTGKDFDFVNTTSGFCLQFNGVNKTYRTSYPGSYGGLYLLLNADQDNYLFTRSKAAGFRILLHSKNEIPKVQELGFKALTGHVVSAATRLTSIIQLPKPYGNCSNDESYSNIECNFNCYQEYVKKLCNCRQYVYKTFSDSNACSLKDMFMCSDGAGSTINNIVQLCPCAQNCKNDHYQVQLSSAPISEYTLEVIAEAECPGCNQTMLNEIITAVKKDYTELEIYFDKLLREELKTISAYSLLALLCDIGGALGLILGSTILTFFEVLDFGIVALYEYALWRMNEAKKKKNIAPISPLK